MSSANETVAEIKYRIYSHWRGCENCSLEEMDGADLIAIADQFEAAHKRELAAKDDERLTVVANYENVIAAKDRIIAAKDAEIAKLNAKCKEYERQPELMAETAREALRTLQEQDAEIAELRQRIKEADEFAAEMKQSTNSLVRACGHQMILRLARR